MCYVYESCGRLSGVYILKYAGMFGELVMKLLDERPHLLLHDIVRG